MKEEGGPDLSVRSRKRKANVAVVSTKDTGWEGPPPTIPSYLGTKFGSSLLLMKRISLTRRFPLVQCNSEPNKLFSPLFSPCFCLCVAPCVPLVDWYFFVFVSFCKIQMKKLPRLTRL